MAEYLFMATLMLIMVVLVIPAVACLAWLCDRQSVAVLIGGGLVLLLLYILPVALALATWVTPPLADLYGATLT